MEPLTTALLVAGGANALGSILGGFGGAQAGREKRKALNAGIKTLQGATDQAILTQQPFLQGGTDAFNRAGILAGEDIPEAQFGYQKQISDFLNPAMEFEQDQARKAILAESLASGTAGSGAMAKELSDRAQQIARQNYQQGFANMMEDKGFDYNVFSQDLASRRQARQQRMSELMNLAGMGQASANNISSLQSNLGTNVANLQTQKGAVNAQISAMPWVVGGQLASSVGQVAPSIAGSQAGGVDIASLLKLLSPQAQAGGGMSPLGATDLGNGGLA